MDTSEPTEVTDGAVQAGPGAGAWDAGGGPGAGSWTNDAGLSADGGTSGGTTGGSIAGATAGGATTGGTFAGGFTAGGFISGGLTAGGFISGGFTAGGFTAGGFTAGGSPGGRDAGAGVDASVSTDAGTVSNGSDPYAELRQVCVDTINMYRASLGLAPVTRANAEQEACSDRGAKNDGDMNAGHASATSGLCRSVGLPGIQNTCPNWGVGPRTGNATLADALKKCLAQMWAEGMPPVSVAACKQDLRGCFHTYGHWINMSEPTNVGVSCGFYDIGNGTYWMNQDFLSSMRFF